MTAGADIPPPTPPTIDDRVTQLETDLKQLAELGKSAYEEIVARLGRLEGSTLYPPPPAAPTPVGLSADEVAAQSGWVKRE